MQLNCEQIKHICIRDDSHDLRVILPSHTISAGSSLSLLMPHGKVPSAFPVQSINSLL